MSNTLQQLADAIYIECFGHLDDKVFHASKTQEILDWLTEGDDVIDASVEQLSNEWREYDSADPNIR